MYRARLEATALTTHFFKLPDTLLLVFGRDGILQMVSEAWSNTLGYTRSELYAMSFMDLLHEEDRKDSADRLATLSPDNPTLRFSTRCRTQDGSHIGIAWNVSFDHEGGLYYVSAHETAVHLSGKDARLPDVFMDGLTGLPNRSLFLDRLEHALHRNARRKDALFAVLYCGIDRFKVVNHSLGHRMGDLLLMNVANAIRNTIRPADMVARLAGDEFGLLLEDIRDVSSTLHVVQRIQEKLVLPFSLGGHEVFTTVSFGIVVSDFSTRDPDEMIRDANIAMMRAKTQGGGGYVVVNKEMHDRAVHRMQLEFDLRHAVERHEFEAYYQPIVSLKDNSLTGFEALVRWRHPVKGLISPAEFIPVTEETGLIVPLGRWMLRQACQQARDWQKRYADRAPLTVSVNLSARQLLHPEIITDITQALDASGLPAELLKLEITESAMMEDATAAIELLNRLKKMGIKLLLDDFGTGYSSLSYLHRLPIDTLKVDRAFVMNLHQNETDCQFVDTIVHLAHQLGRDVICEGVELEVQARKLAAMGVEYSQGFLYSRPVAAHEAEMLIITGLESESA